nr:hypothetical protein [Tanacetum cinerariifolium]
MERKQNLNKSEAAPKLPRVVIPTRLQKHRCASLLCESSTQSKPSKFDFKSWPLVLKPKTFKPIGREGIAKVEFKCVWLGHCFGQLLLRGRRVVYVFAKEVLVVLYFGGLGRIGLPTLIRLHTAKTFDLVWMWWGGDYGNVFLTGFKWDPVVNMYMNFLYGSDSEQRTHEFIHVYLASASVYVWIGNKIMARLQFYDYHNMVSILEKSEHNVDFHLIVDFVEASPLRIVPFFDTMLVSQGEGSGTPTEPHHTPSFEVQQTSSTTPSSPTLPSVTTAPILTVTLSDTPTLRQYTRGARIAQSSALPPVANEHASPLRDVSEDEAAAERVSDDTEEMATVLTSIDAATFLASGVAEVSTGSESIPTVGPPAAEVPTGSDVVPTVGLIFATATVVTPYTRRKGKETMKKKVQEHIDAQVARELEEQMAREDQRMTEQIMIDGLDKSNEILAKYLQEYHQFALELPLERRIELISDLVRYQDNYAKESLKKLKTSESVPEEVKLPDEVPKEKVKEMMQLVPIEEVYVEALQVKHPIIDWKHLDREDLNQLWALVKESLSNRPPTSDKDIELWVELKRLYEPDDEDQLWTHTQNLMHAPDYPLRKGLAIGMIRYKLRVKNYSKMANDLILKIYKIASSPRQQVIDFPLPEEVSTASEKSCHCQKKREAIAVKIALLLKSRRRNYQSKSNDGYAKRSITLQIVQDREVVEGVLSSDEFPLPEEVPTTSEENSPC